MGIGFLGLKQNFSKSNFKQSYSLHNTMDDSSDPIFFNSRIVLETDINNTGDTSNFVTDTDQHDTCFDQDEDDQDQDENKF